ncbi:MAG: hypothetical protein LBT38_03140 [Deltaproteobacteria bacterium]|nr:hypothetical protein [Deltaproteobacteria bacterium]
MSRVIVESIKHAVIEAQSLLSKLIQICPENLFDQKIGYWPLWQHLASYISSVDAVTSGPAIDIPAPLTEQVVKLQVKTPDAPPKTAILGYFQAIQAKTATFIDSLKDEDLKKSNDLIQPADPSWTNTRTLFFIANRAHYHLGRGDAILIRNGLEGVL